MGLDGSDINAVDRSHSGHLLACGDDFGKVNLYRYPCLDSVKSACVEHHGHSSHVTNVRWMAGDGYLVSCGGNDKSIMHWKHSVSGDDTSGVEKSVGGVGVTIAEDTFEGDDDRAGDHDHELDHNDIDLGGLGISEAFAGDEVTLRINM